MHTARKSAFRVSQKATIATMVSVLFSSNIYAHTSSVGYENAGAGAVTFWYGTYHSGVNFTEGSLEVTGPNSYSVTTPFTLLVTNKPAGLIDGVTNFYSDGTSLVGTGSYSNSILAWQGSTFSNLTPGTYLIFLTAAPLKPGSRLTSLFYPVRSYWMLPFWGEACLPPTPTQQVVALPLSLIAWWVMPALP